MLKLKLFAIENGNWNIFIDNDKHLYSIAKEETGCKNSTYGTIKHFLNMSLNYNNDKITMNEEYKNDINTIMNTYANKKELEKFNNIINFEKLNHEYIYN